MAIETNLDYFVIIAWAFIYT